MLSFIYQSVCAFQREHGFRPNVLYIAPEHFERLRADFVNPDDLAAIRRILGMEILMRRDVPHPRVGWSQVAAHEVV